MNILKKILWFPYLPVMALSYVVGFTGMVVMVTGLFGVSVGIWLSGDEWPIDFSVKWGD